MILVMTGLALHSESSVLVNKQYLSLSVRVPFCMCISQEVKLPVSYFTTATG